MTFLAAVLLAIVARCLDLTDDDLAVLGPVMRSRTRRAGREKGRGLASRASGVGTE